ncbi:hypothetical protein CBS101457_000211 [Exobasidium rhododendri]|nr:hypothetical protein CBS101457_000211 [Exobasidium rhododendri]
MNFTLTLLVLLLILHRLGVGRCQPLPAPFPTPFDHQRDSGRRRSTHDSSTAHQESTDDFLRQLAPDIYGSTAESVPSPSGSSNDVQVRHVRRMQRQYQDIDRIQSGRTIQGYYDDGKGSRRLSTYEAQRPQAQRNDFVDWSYFHEHDGAHPRLPPSNRNADHRNSPSRDHRPLVHPQRQSSMTHIGAWNTSLQASTSREPAPLFVHHILNHYTPSSSPQGPALPDRAYPSTLPLERQQQRHAPCGTYEYTLPVTSNFPYMNLTDRVYKGLSEDQTLLIVDRIMQIRPYMNDTIRRYLRTNLDVVLARELLSDDIRVVETAIDILYPTERRKRRRGDPWMTGLTNAERRHVIERLARATQQREDHLRAMFLREKVTPETARRILDAANEEDCARIAASHGLIMPPKPGLAPWAKGLSQIQKRALQCRITAFAPALLGDSQSWSLLDSSHAPSGFGLTLLRASDADFARYLRWLSGETLV